MQQPMSSYHRFCTADLRKTPRELGMNKHDFVGVVCGAYAAYETLDRGLDQERTGLDTSNRLNAFLEELGEDQE